MPKYSVKKPMTVFVVIVIIIALGVVSLLGMTPRHKRVSGLEKS